MDAYLEIWLGIQNNKIPVCHHKKKLLNNVN